MDMKPVSSSMLNAVGYDKDEKKLTVEFSNGATYEYEEVEPEIYEEFVNADSVGKYFLYKIKPNYTGVRI